MNYIYIFSLAFTIALTGALVPGPLLMLVIAKSLKYGKKTGPIVIGGHAFLELIMVSVLVFGLGKVIKNPVVIKSISIAGALILIYSGTEILKTLPKISFNISVNSYGSSATLFFNGITMSIANPYWTVWWLTVGFGLLLTARESGIKGILFFFAGHILADLLWYTFVSYSIDKGKRFISEKTYREILGICAVVIIIFGLYFGISPFL